MKLHVFPEEFQELITVVANDKHISESAVERDYYIVMMLKALADSPYAEQCVFKGGTSLSKCYPGSIDRFSEDIDLTFLGTEMEDKDCERSIKKIESVMSAGAQTEKINHKRFPRSKSMYVWFKRISRSAYLSCPNCKKRVSKTVFLSWILSFFFTQPTGPCH